MLQKKKKTFCALVQVGRVALSNNVKICPAVPSRRDQSRQKIKQERNFSFAFCRIDRRIEPIMGDNMRPKAGIHIEARGKQPRVSLPAYGAQVEIAGLWWLGNAGGADGGTAGLCEK